MAPINLIISLGSSSGQILNSSAVPSMYSTRIQPCLNGFTCNFSQKLACRFASSTCLRLRNCAVSCLSISSIVPSIKRERPNGRPQSVKSVKSVVLIPQVLRLAGCCCRRRCCRRLHWEFRVPRPRCRLQRTSLSEPACSGQTASST